MKGTNARNEFLKKEEKRYIVINTTLVPEIVMERVIVTQARPVNKHNLVIMLGTGLVWSVVKTERRMR